ncbi:histidine phosphatase family protein [Pseudomonas sp. PvR086]
MTPSRFSGTTQADRKPYAESYCRNGDAVFTDAPGDESLNQLLGRADVMLAKLAAHEAKEIPVFSHGQFMRAAAWLIKHQKHAGSPDLIREFRATYSSETPASPLLQCANRIMPRSPGLQSRLFW